MEETEIIFKICERYGTNIAIVCLLIVIVLGIIVFCIKHCIDGYIQASVNSMLEKQKFVYAKQNRSFAIYVKKRLKILLKFHRLLISAKSEVLNATNIIKTVPDFAAMSNEDTVEWINSQDLLTEVYKAKILRELEGSPDLIRLEKLHGLYKSLEIRRANNAITGYNNYRLYWQLYLPKKVFEDGATIYQSLNELIIDYENATIPDQGGHKRREKMRGKIENMINEIVQCLRESLSDYDIK